MPPKAHECTIRTCVLLAWTAAGCKQGQMNVLDTCKLTGASMSKSEFHVGSILVQFCFLFWVSFLFHCWFHFAQTSHGLVSKFAFGVISFWIGIILRSEIQEHKQNIKKCHMGDPKQRLLIQMCFKKGMFWGNVFPEGFTASFLTKMLINEFV